MAPLVIGFVGETISWHLGFTLAAIGMLIGLMQFLFNQNKIISDDLTGETKRLNFNDWFQIISISAITIPLVLVVFKLNEFIKVYYLELLALLLFFFNTSISHKD